MSTSSSNSVHGEIQIKGEQPNFHGNEVLNISVRDTLRHDADCIELGTTSIPLTKGQELPVNYKCVYDPTKAHMDFEQIRSVPGGITLSAWIERNDDLLYANDTDHQLAEQVDILLVKIE